MADSSARKKINFSKSVVTYNTILDAVELLIEEIGINELSIQNIAEKSGFGVGTLYLYFDNKESFLEALLRREVFNINNQFHETILPKLPMKPEELLFDCFLILLKNKKIHIYNKLFSMIPVLDKGQAGGGVTNLIVENLENEVNDSLKIKLEKNELNRKVTMLFHALRGLLSVDLSQDKKATYSTEEYAKWLTKFSLSFLQNSEH